MYAVGRKSVSVYAVPAVSPSAHYRNFAKRNLPYVNIFQILSYSIMNRNSLFMRACRDDVEPFFNIINYETYLPGTLSGRRSPTCNRPVTYIYGRSKFSIVISFLEF